MSDLINEKEIKEALDSAKKTWKWLKKLFNPQNNLNDDEFAKTLINEANNQSDVNKNNQTNSNFAKDFIELGKNTSDTKNLNYFGKKSIELDSISQDKESFINEFKNYAKNFMSIDEMKILISMSNNKSDKLNKEHKILLKECLNLIKINPNYSSLDNGYKIIMKANNNEKIGTQGVRDFIHLVKHPNNKIDQAIKKDCLKPCVENILKNNELPKITILKLQSLINPNKSNKKTNNQGKQYV